MQMRAIESFLALYEDRSFSKASRRLYITQQGLSRQIQALEKELGRQLFTRGRLGSEPTETAHLLYPYGDSHPELGHGPAGDQPGGAHPPAGTALRRVSVRLRPALLRAGQPRRAGAAVCPTLLRPPPAAGLSLSARPAGKIKQKPARALHIPRRAPVSSYVRRRAAPAAAAAGPADRHCRSG